MDHSKISIVANVGVDPIKAWELWTLPTHIVKWNFASDDWHCPKAENDLRVGGKMKSRMEAKDGSFGFDFEGIYDDVVNGKKIAYSMDDGRKVITTFEDIGGSTKITTVFDAENTHPVEMQRDGWQAVLNNYKKYAESENTL